MGLLSRGLPSKNNAYLPSPSVQEDSKPTIRSSVSNSSNSFTNQSYNFADSTGGTNGNGTNPSAYLPGDSALAHQQTPYPTATQYSTYPDPTSNSGTLTYNSQETHNFTNYPTSTADPAEAPLLAEFAAQASQVAPTTWARPQTHSAGSASRSQAWQQWTATMAGNLEPQDCYSASALMQLGGRDGGQSNDISTTQTNVLGGDLSNGNLTGVMNSHIGSQTTSALGVTWPLNIFDISHAQGASGS